MLFSLLLQTHTTTVEITSLTNVYIALGGTFLAAVLSTIASLVASSRTAQTARDMKERDYENEYYKKIIENRFAAYKLVEKLLATLYPHSENTAPNKPFLIIFYVSIPFYITDRNLDLSNPFLLDENKYSEKEKESWYFNLFLSKLAEALTQEAWLSNELYTSLKDLFDDLINISAVYQRINKHNYNPGALLKLGKKHYRALATRRDALKPLFLKDLLSLHEVQNFVNRKL